jgi:transposase
VEETSPPFVQKIQQEHPEEKVEVFFQDEMRYGQKGGTHRLWAKRGTTPVRVKSTGFTATYFFGAVNPLSGQRVGLILPACNTEGMNLFLQTLRVEVDPKVHIVLVLDQAGWHRSKGLILPSDMTLLPLPPYSPQLNPVERLWKYLKETYLNHRLDHCLDEMIEAGCFAWQALTDELIQSLCFVSWLKGHH